MKIKAAARSSPLSRAQAAEIQRELWMHYPEIEWELVLVETPGDRDRSTSLRNLGKTDFFTRDLDEMIVQGGARIAIHSAKDLPCPILKGLALAALTRGMDPRDSLVFRRGLTLAALPLGARIAASSLRREKAVKQLRADLCCFDLRGTIGERLSLLEKGEADGVVVAEAALIRLRLTSLPRLILPGSSSPLQGRLAVLSREGDEEMRKIFQAIHAE